MGQGLNTKVSVDTVTEQSGIQITDICLIAEWSAIRMVIWLKVYYHSDALSVILVT